MGVLLDEDRCHAARHARHPFDKACINAQPLKIGQGGIGKSIVADLAEHQHVRAQQRCGSGLIGTLAAAAHGKTRCFERLALGRHAFDVSNQVDHVAADDCNLAHCYFDLTSADGSLDGFIYVI
ncbi:hypothetical protein PsyrH_17050 [Pseudomonas syringae pv. syringae HS191]|nr:hypothetical protein PsyrH_17050 [Pseudomonas syringae pv. syringae HS191]